MESAAAAFLGARCPPSKQVQSARSAQRRRRLIAPAPVLRRAGFLFLLSFWGWGLYCLPAVGRPQGPQASKGLWGAVSALALLAILMQLCFQVGGGPGQDRS